jgi:hypothetical protein
MIVEILLIVKMGVSVVRSPMIVDMMVGCTGKIPTMI